MWYARSAYIICKLRSNILQMESKWWECFLIPGVKREALDQMFLPSYLDKASSFKGQQNANNEDQSF